MSFQGQHFTGGVFQLGAPNFGAAPEPPSRLQVRSSRIPAFTVKRERSGWWSSLGVLLSRAVRISPGDGVFKKVMFGRRYFRGPSFSLSLVGHVAGVSLLLLLPQFLITDAPELEFVPNRIETIYYVPPPEPKPEIEKKPAAAPAPAKKSPPPAPKETPKKDAFLAPKLAHPEQVKKALSQTSAPPVLRINSQEKLPDVILATPVETPKMPMIYNANATKPTLQAREVTAVPLPSPRPSDQSPAGLTVLSNSTKMPILPIAVGPIVMGRSSSGGGGLVEAPKIDGGSAQGGGAGSALFVVTGPTIPGGMGGNGNGSGAGSVSGSPSGNGTAGYGSSGSGKGGTPGGTGGGNGGGNGSGGTGPGNGVLKGPALPSTVFAIPSELSIRKNAMVISAGPVGGGGLDVYQALDCGKVDTVFFDMPGKNWSMEYCPLSASGQAETASVTRVVQLRQGIIPPQAESKFDFQRLPVPEIKAHKMIVLKGMLHEDGSVGEIEIYQSILPAMDEYARVAFSHWKFKPALQQGKPIPVQILVGIPVDGGTPAKNP